MKRSQLTARARQRMDDLAQLVADGLTVAQAGCALGMTKGEQSRSWANIKKALGAQAI